MEAQKVHYISTLLGMREIVQREEGQCTLANTHDNYFIHKDYTAHVVVVYWDASANCVQYHVPPSAYEFPSDTCPWISCDGT